MQAGTAALSAGLRLQSESLENIQVLCYALKMAEVINTTQASLKIFALSYFELEVFRTFRTALTSRPLEYFLKYSSSFFHKSRPELTDIFCVELSE